MMKCNELSVLPLSFLIHSVDHRSICILLPRFHVVCLCQYFSSLQATTSSFLFPGGPPYVDWAWKTERMAGAPCETQPLGHPSQPTALKTRAAELGLDVSRIPVRCCAAAKEKFRQRVGEFMAAEFRRLLQPWRPARML